MNELHIAAVLAFFLAWSALVHWLGYNDGYRAGLWDRRGRRR